MKRVVVILGFLSIVTLICVRSNQGKQEDSSDSAKLHKICENVLDHLVKGESDEALSIMQQNYASPPSETESNYLRFNYSEQIKLFQEKFGKPVGYELIEEKKAGDNMLKCTYLLKLEKFPVRFEFCFYRAKDTWKLLYSHYDSNSPEYFK